LIPGCIITEKREQKEGTEGLKDKRKGRFHNCQASNRKYLKLTKRE